MSDWANSQPLSSVLNGLKRYSTALPVTPIRQGLLLLTGIWILSMSADVFWMLVPQPSSAALPAMMQTYSAAGARAPVVRSEKPQIDIANMQSWHLFGQNKQELVVVEQTPLVNDDEALDAKETRLNLKLLGVMLSTGNDSYAVIEHAGKAELYRIGDAIPGGQNVKLSRVLADRAIIDNRGNLESLLLYDDSQQGGGVAPVAARPQPVRNNAQQVVDQRNNPHLTQMASAYREQLMSNPMSLADVIRVSIAKDADGNVIGYSIRPGRDRKQFADFGLQSGDIVTAVNGISLDDPAKAMELYGQLRTAQEASFAIKRGNEDISVIVGLSE